MGEKKLREFGDVFLTEIADHLKVNARQIFADDSFAVAAVAAAPKPRLTDTIFQSLHAVRQGRSVAEVAAQRDLTVGTIFNHLTTAVEAGEAFDLNLVLSPAQQRRLAAAFVRLGPGNLTGIRELVGEEFDFNQLRLYRATLGR